MATVEISDERVAGRAAADRLAKNWDDREWIPDAPSTMWARAAVDRLGEIIATQPSILRASMKGAGKGASTLSPRPFQGIVECLQNADDLGASRLCVVYRSVPRRELLIIHDGSPVTLAHVGAMLLPWLSTKDGDPEASGRFGIGQRTLGSLGGPIAMHAPPFHFIIGDEGPQPCNPAADITGVYGEACRDTMLVIPLLPTVTGESLAEAVRELDVYALIFLKSIRSLQFRSIEDPFQDLDFTVEVAHSGESKITFGDEEALVELSEVRIATPAGASSASSYRRYLTRRTVSPGEQRSNKATGHTTPVGLCVPINGAPALRLYDRIPLPVRTGLTIGLNAQFDPDSARSTLQPNKWNEARFADLGRLVTWSVLQAFEQDILSAWVYVPLTTEPDQDDGWTDARIRDLVASCHQELRDQLKVRTGGGATALSDLAYENEELEPLLTEQDVERLRPDRVALPRAGRDSEGRWRLVLDDLGQSDVVGLTDALDVVDGTPGRSPEWFVAFAALAEAHDLTPQFVSRPGILLEDGTAISRPQQTDTWVLVKRASPEALAMRLGLARRIHPVYLDPDAKASAFVHKLEILGVLFDDRDFSADVFSILERGPATGAGAETTVRLQDG